MKRLDAIADLIVEIIGSWMFLIIQTLITFIYIVINIYGPEWMRFDPYPFIFLNLGLSFEAAYTTIFVMISQNKMSKQDRALAIQDNENTKKILHTIKKLEANLITKIDEIDED